MIKTAWLVTNYSCNSHCDYCYAASANISGSVMSIDYAKSVLNELSRIGAKDCLIIGGEPTLVPILFDIIAYGNQLGLQMKIVSNGRKLRDREFLNKLISSGINHISISLEASDEKTYNKICGVNGLQETVDGIKNCVESEFSMNSVTTISQNNKDSVRDIAHFVHSLGVKNILFNYGMPTVYSNNDDGIFLSPEELAQSAITAYRQLKKDGIKVRFFGTIPVCAYGEVALEMIRDKYIPPGTSCHMFSGRGIVFEPSGKITPCTHFVDTGLFTSKNKNDEFTLKGNLDVVWKSENGIRKRFHDALWQYPSVECENCILWGKCLGGCPLLWKVFDADANTKRISENDWR